MKKFRAIGTTLGLFALASAFTLPTLGCDQQQTAAELVSTVGTATSSLLQFEGNPFAASQVTASVAVATAAITNWKSGSPTQDIAEALNLVEDDLNLIPVSTTDKALVDLAIGAVDQLLALFPGKTVSPVVVPATAGAPSALLIAYQTIAPARPHVAHRKVYLAKTPKTAKQFKAQWNAAIVVLKPGLAPLK